MTAMEKMKFRVTDTVSETLEFWAEDIGIPLDELISTIIEELAVQTEGYGEASISIRPDRYTSDFLKDSVAWGKDVSAIVNSALNGQRTRRLAEATREFSPAKCHRQDKNGQFSTVEICAQQQIDETLGRSNEERYTEFFAQVSLKAAEYLVYRTYYDRISTGQILEDALDASEFIQSHCRESEGTEKFVLNISAENMEFLRQGAKNGRSWQTEFCQALEGPHMAAVKEKKDKGEPLTELEKELESMHWD